MFLSSIDGINQENPAGGVVTDESLVKFGHVHADELPSGAFGQLHDEFLRKGKKENRAAGALATRNHAVERLQPAKSVLGLVLRPDANEGQNGLHLVFAAFLVKMASAIRLVHGKELLSPQFRVGT